MSQKIEFPRIFGLSSPQKNKNKLLTILTPNLNLQQHDALFANNYHMMADHFTDERTKRSIRKHILINYGRLMPISHNFGIEEDRPLSLPKKQNISNFLDSDLIDIVKENITYLKMTKKKTLRLKSDQQESKGELLPNKMVLSKFINQSPRTDNWDLKLQLMISELEDKQTLSSNETYHIKQNHPRKKSDNEYKKSQRKQRAIQSLNQPRSFQSSPQPKELNLRRNTLSYQQQYDQSVPNNDYCKKVGKHVILLKNLYLN